jgi:hypothetical protein
MFGNFLSGLEFIKNTEVMPVYYPLFTVYFHEAARTASLFLYISIL